MAVAIHSQSRDPGPLQPSLLEVLYEAFANVMLPTIELRRISIGAVLVLKRFMLLARIGFAFGSFTVFGFRCTPFTRNSKCRCGAVAQPVDPTNPMV